MPLVTEHAAVLPGGYCHVVLSPHLDDAALSCGGFIARATAAGEPVLVVNVCSGSPPPDAPFSAFAQLLHERWELPPATVVAQRRAEDAAALRILGADALLWPALDAIYRRPDAYSDETSLFGSPVCDDPLAADVADLVAMLAQRYPAATFYLPLAVGMHVDHQLVFAAATAALLKCGASCWYYEDFPYARTAGAVAQRLAMIGQEHYAPHPIPLDEPVLSAKIAAIAAYASQMGVLFGSAAAMPAAVTAYAEQVASLPLRYAERQWVRL
ncbi:PIG-L deacetylase family protein [uncultured Chloroflexus sp.]|uniref:PIG-L deacetylase family protein n=1 Tax=uncultured Chloroflexus sp. TaxID=214040 RepID=UPI00260AAD9B|nr:PIG-L family deacetylase [uncultured Chloroflexus sp.]